MKIWDMVNELNSQFAEREEVIEGLIVAMIARQHVLLIGPPGTGKSALVTELAQRFTGVNYFQWLLTRFSTPEELFGPVSLKELEHGVYKRNTFGKLPEAQVSFLDEIFKANSTILNALLTLINERLFYNDGTPIQVPLMSLIGSSNEYPEEGEGLEALFDRFLLRFEVGYIAEEQAFLSMLQGGSSQAVDMTMDEMFQLQMLCDAVAIPDVVYEALSKMRLELRDQGIQPSDRRFKQALSIIRAKAVLAGRRHTVIEDMNILKNSLWETPNQRDKVAKIVRYYSQDAIKTKIQDIYLELKDMLQAFKANGNSTEGALEATKKIKSIMADLKTLQKDNAGREEIDQAISFTTECLSEVTNSVLGV